MNRGKRSKPSYKTTHYLYWVMRTFLFIIYLFSLGIISSAQSHAGIRFFEGSWQQLLDSAQARSLPIFVDVYTDWCGPCKRMEQEVLVKSEVGAYYQTHFICYRLNAEKGEGPRLSKAYGVGAYPTWLFLDPHGVLRSHLTDYMTPAAFIDMGKAALGQDSVSSQLSTLDARFRSGHRDTAFLRAYLTVRTALQLDNAAILNAYVARLSTTTPSPASLRLLLQHAGRTWSAAIPFIADNLTRFSRHEQKTVAAKLFGHSLYYAWGDAIKSGDSAIATQALAIERLLYPQLDSTLQLTADKAAVFYGRTFHLAAPLRAAGYRLAATQMAIDTNFAHLKDAELYAQVMAPFRSGQQDSTRISPEELSLATRQYSGKAAALLYEVAKAFAETLPPGDSALQDAAQWAVRAAQLVPNAHTRALVERLGVGKQ